MRFLVKVMLITTGDAEAAETRQHAVKATAHAAAIAEGLLDSELSGRCGIRQTLAAYAEPIEDLPPGGEPGIIVHMGAQSFFAPYDGSPNREVTDEEKAAIEDLRGKPWEECRGIWATPPEEQPDDDGKNLPD